MPLTAMTGGDFGDQPDAGEVLPEDAVLSPIEGVTGVNSLSGFVKRGFYEAVLPAPSPLPTIWPRYISTSRKRLEKVRAARLRKLAVGWQRDSPAFLRMRE